MRSLEREMLALARELGYQMQRKENGAWCLIRHGVLTPFSSLRALKEYLEKQALAGGEGE